MANLKEIKNRISSVSSTQQITRAMKMVAAAKLRRAQERITQLRPYVQKLSEVLQNVSSSLSTETHNPFAEESDDLKNVLVVAISSDRGLCGGFNANVAKAVVRLVGEQHDDLRKSGNLEVLTIGKKVFDYFRKRDYKLIDKYTSLFGNLTFDNVKAAAEFAMDGFLTKKYDKVYLVYNEFKNVATQIIRTEQFLPIPQEEKEVPQNTPTKEIDYIFEPSKEEIVRLIIPKTLKISFYKAVLESNASEHGARMTAMDKATDNAQELLKELKLTYNRSRQAAITTEILEIVGGAEALAQG